MPQVLLLFAAGAGLVLAGRRWYVRERSRIAAELRAAKEAMDQHADTHRAAGSRPPDRHLPAETAALSPNRNTVMAGCPGIHVFVCI